MTAERARRTLLRGGLGCMAALLAACAPRSEDPAAATQATAPSGTHGSVEVTCSEDLTLALSTSTVAATAAGVDLRVSSDAPAGAYLDYGIGGDELPASSETWTLALPPGRTELSCSTLEVEGAPVELTVVDPAGHWSTRTLEELGCPIGGTPSWVVEGGSGASPREAAEALAASLNAEGYSPALDRVEHAAVGYPYAAAQTWILGSADATQLTAVVTSSEGTYTAWPDALCVSSAWVEAS